MNDLLEEVNELHTNFNDELDKKLELIDECLEHGKECPCEVEDCTIDLEKLEKMNSIYDAIAKKNEFVFSKMKTY